MSKYLYIALLIIVFTAPAIGANSTMEFEAFDAQGNTVDSLFEVRKDGNLLESSSNRLDSNFTSNENYTLKQEYNLAGETVEVTIYELNLTSDISPSIRLVNYTGPYLQQNETVFALDDSNIQYSSAEISYERSGSPRNISYCSDFSFSSPSCSSWSLDSAENYEKSFSQNQFSFNTSSFSAYTVGDTAPLLEVLDIEIYNVTGLSASERRKEGQLLEEGLNKTFEITQSSETSYLRFEFNITNSGTANWSLRSEDQLRHEGVDSNWNIDQIWYSLGGEQTGGSFSSGTVFWDTSNRGKLVTEGKSSSMNASYTIETSLGNSELYNQNFLANDTSEQVYDQDYHMLEARKSGQLEIDLMSPPNQSVLPQNELFYLEANVTCKNGDCGQVTGTPRSNDTGTQGMIPSTVNQPFYIESTTRDSCSLDASQSCVLNWTVNATAQTESYHLLDVNASSEFNEGYSSSKGHEVEIDLLVLMSLSWEAMDFGFLSPGDENKSAEGNDALMYNITVDESSKHVDGLWIKGTDLVSEADPSYSIDIRNVSYRLQNNISDENTIFKDYTRMRSDISPGTVLNTFYWIYVPVGMTQSGYDGTLTFKANVTG